MRILNSRTVLLAATATAFACGDSLTGPGPGEFTPLAACTGGMAGAFPCDGIDLIAQVTPIELGATGAVRLNDVWGWTDPSSGREYALVGRMDGVGFVDLGDPENPRVLGWLPGTHGSVSAWRDVKVYRNHAFVVADGIVAHGIQVFDLTRLRGVDDFTTFDEDARYDGVAAVHNIAIDEETGFAYAVGSNWGGTTCGGGLHMVDIRSPKAPTFAGCYARTGTGRSGTGYTHDVQCVVYEGPDTEHRGREICFASNETDVVIVDVTDKANPRFLSSATYPDAAYVHQGWLTEDQSYFLQNDELDEANGAVASSRMLVWDVSDLDDPNLVKEYLGPTPAIDHNLYVRGDLAYYSNYTYGFRLVDVSNPRNPSERGHFDTHPLNDSSKSFAGSWSNYPYFESGIIIVTSTDDGLFVLQRR